jgi:tetratricopeptide (TPR) repeat protein
VVGLVCCLGQAAWLGPLASVSGSPGEGIASRPPWQRLLQGADAEQAARLEDQLTAAQQTGKWAEAMRAAEELLELRQKAQGKDHWQAVDARWQLEALRAAKRQSKELQQEYAGLPALDAQAEALLARGRHREAQPLLEKALEVRRKVLGEEYPRTASSYNNLAFNLHGQGKYAPAEKGFRKALDVFRKVLGEEHPETGASYGNLSVSLNAQGKYAAAEDSARKALAIRRKVLGEEHPLTAQSLSNLGFTLHAQARYVAAEDALRKALEIHRKVLGEEDLQTATSYNNLAGVLHDQGNYAAAEQAMRKVLHVRRKVLGEEHPDTADSCSNLAGILHAQGRYAAAEEGLRKALGIRRKVLGEEHPLTALSYNNLAFNLNALGKYAAAEEGFRKALDIRRKVLGDEHLDTAGSHAGMARNLSDQGKHTAAAEGDRKALDIYLVALGEDHPLTALGYNNLAYSLHKLGKYVEAEEGYGKALAIRRKVLGEEHPITASSYHNLAGHLNALGKYAAAEDSFKKALDVYCKLLGQEHPDTAGCCTNLAANLHAQGKYTEAEKLCLRAADAFARARSRLAHSGLERATVTSKISPLPLLAAVLARNGKPEAAWQRFEESLARGTWDDFSARLRRPPAEQAHQAALAARLDRLDRLIERAVAVKDETPEQKEQREDLLSQRQNVQEELDAFIALLEKTYGPAAGQIFDAPHIQAALANDMALVGWIDLKPVGPKAANASGEHWAFLLRSRGKPVCVRLSGNDDADAWTAEDIRLPIELRTAVRQRRPGWQPLAQRLHRQRLLPLAKYLAAGAGLPAVRHLVVLPSSDLLAGLPVELFAGDLTVSYALSGTLHAHLRKQPPVKGTGLLALGDPMFEVAPVAAKKDPLPPGGVLLTVVQPGSNAAQSRLRPDDVLLKYADVELKTPADLKAAVAAAEGKGDIPVQLWRAGRTTERQVRPGPLGVVVATEPAPKALAARYRLDRVLSSRSGDDDWGQLPGTRVEVESLQKLFSDKPEPRLLFDSDASEQRLDELASGGELGKYRYLHLATHGEVDDASPLRSAVILSRDTLPDPQQQLLAGKPVYDGRLTAEEMLRSWNLNAELVTLSACQTALGKYERGEGFVGFAQALLLCGSRSVCLSLWKVDDAATALLMQRFYANLLGKRDGLRAPMPKAAALREAKEWLRGLSRAEALRVAAQVSQGVERGKGRPRQKLLPPLPEPVPAAKDDHPYAHPYYWAAFVLIGDPD